MYMYVHEYMRIYVHICMYVHLMMKKHHQITAKPFAEPFAKPSPQSIPHGPRSWRCACAAQAPNILNQQVMHL